MGTDGERKVFVRRNLPLLDLYCRLYEEFENLLLPRVIETGALKEGGLIMSHSMEFWFGDDNLCPVFFMGFYLPAACGRAAKARMSTPTQRCKTVEQVTTEMLSSLFFFFSFIDLEAVVPEGQIRLLF